MLKLVVTEEKTTPLCLSFSLIEWVNFINFLSNSMLCLTMDTIIKYLQNPMKIGVYNYKSIIDFSGISDYLQKLIAEYKESFTKAEGKKKYPRRVFETRLSELGEAIQQLKEERPKSAAFFDSLCRTYREFARLDEFPKELGDLFFREREIKMSSGRVIKAKFRTPKPPVIFDSHLIPASNDILSIEKEQISKGKWLFDVVTVKKAGLTAFKKYFLCIPVIKEGMTVLKEKRQFSTRYTFRPYALATELWLKDSSSITVPSDLKSFLHGGIRYFSSGEWRTSIVLSAIAVESVLADLYEEKYKEAAPDVPLGDLFHQVKQKIDFPPEIVKAIEMTNKARIAAVHRSRFPVSDRESINALFGATNFTLWYSSQF